MSEIKIKNPSSLVEAIVKLDNYFSEMVRLGQKIDTMDLKSDFDFEQAERLIKLFAECGEGVSEEVINMSNALTELRAQAEAAASLVAIRAEQLQARKTEQAQKMEEFRMLGEKVRELTLSLSSFRIQEGQPLSIEEKARLAGRLEEFESRLRPLIDEANNLRREGQSAKMRILEQNADSLGQSLQAVSQKIHLLREEHPN
ncbi:hypothetical protein [Bdellovibrio sp. HCB337]|uniref:hypothetical protein n=1 Tax=Bdellovibrio sp. HCB337 TaxID=3394358 RepID=UPI0039A4E84C